MAIRQEQYGGDLNVIPFTLQEIEMKVVSIAGALTALSLVVVAGGAQAGAKSATRDSAPHVLAAEATDGGAPLTLYVEGPTGANFRLIYRAGQGWRFADRIAADGRLSLALDRGLLPGMAEAIATEEPQTVFIDGPTGNIFVWFLDRGWQFVGHIAEAGR